MSNSLNIKYLEAAANHLENNDMDEWELRLFQQDQLDYQTSYSKALQNVNNAYVANDGTLRHVVGVSIQTLEDAVEEFKSSI